METEFTPWVSLAGGVLIGMASVLLMLMQGRIAGITGIVSGLLPVRDAKDWSWRAAFTAGLISAPVLWWAASGRMPAIDVPVSLLTLAVGGFIVGVGVTLGSGCTSGHGVCGMARLSRRSVAATLTFMATTALTVFLVRHVVGG